MSDVSGIPYMGPMGQGNFFAPQFPANPQINPTAGYAAPMAYNQSVTNNLFAPGGGFGRQTDYYSGLGASYSAAGMSPYGVFNDPGTGPSRGGGGGSIFDQGAVDNFITSGGGYSFPSIPDYSSFGGGGGGDVRAPSIDWSKVGGAANDLFGGAQQNPLPSMSMPGGLGSPFSAPSGASPFNWSDLWRGGGSSGYTTGIPPDITGGGSAPPSPMTTLSSGGPSWEDAPTTTQSTPTMPSSKSLLGYEPDTFPTKTNKAQEQPAFDLSGPTAGWNNAPAPMPDSKAVLGYEPQQSFAEPDWNVFQSPPTNYETFQGPAQGGGGQDTDLSSANRSAQQLADEARQRLATVIGSPETAKEEPGAAAIPLPRERPAEAPQPTTDRLGNPLYPEETVVRPPAGLPSTGTPAEQEKYQGPPRPSQGVPFTIEPGKEARVAAVDKRLVAAVQGGAQFLPPGYSVEVFSGQRNKPGDSRTSQHYGGNAIDVRIKGPDGEILPQGNDYTGMYTLLARGVKTWTAQNDPGGVTAYGGSFETSGGSGKPDLMHFDRGPARGSLRSDVQFGNLKVLSEAEKNAMPAYIPALGENQVPLDRPVPLGPGYSAPVPPLTDRALPTVPNYRSSGMSASDFAAPPRFGGEGIMPPGDTGGGFAQPWNIPQEGEPTYNTQVYDPVFSSSVMQRGPETTGGPGGASQYDAFRRSENIEDRRDEQLSRDELAALYERGFGYFIEPEEAPTPMGTDLGLGDLPVPRDRTAAAPGFMGRDEANDDSWTPQERTDKWNTDVYVPSHGRGVQHRDESATESRWSGLPGRPEDVTDRRLDPALTRTQEEALNNRPGVPRGHYVETPEMRKEALAAAKTPLAEALGSKDIAEMERNALARSTAGVSAQPTRAASTDEGSDLFDFKSPATDYSAFQQPASRDDLAKTMTFGGGFSPSPEPRQGGVGPEVSLSPEHMQTMAEIESHDDPALHDKGSQYKGLYQLNETEFRKYGGTGDIYDYEQNYGAAGRKMIAEGQRAQDILGRELSPVEQYMVHQQGLAGTLAHLANPDQLAWKSFQSASGRSDEGAKKAIWDNLSDAMKAQFGNDVNNITSRDFINLWNEQYASKAVAAGLSRPGPGGYFNASP